MISDRFAYLRKQACPPPDLEEELARVTAERDALRSENDQLWDDAAHMLDVRNRVLRIAAAEVLPGPDGQDDLDRERLIQRWLDEAHDETELARPALYEAQLRAVRAEAERDALREALEEIELEASMADARGVYTGDDNWRILCDARAALARAAADEHTRLWADEITASPVQEESDG